MRARAAVIYSAAPQTPGSGAAQAIPAKAAGDGRDSSDAAAAELAFGLSPPQRSGLAAARSRSVLPVSPELEPQDRPAQGKPAQSEVALTVVPLLREAFGQVPVRSRSTVPNTQRKSLRKGLALLLGLGVIGVAVSLAPPLVLKPGPRRSPSDLGATSPSAMPDALSLNRAPKELPPSYDAAAPATADAGGKSDGALLGVKFYYLAKDAIDSVSCDGKELVSEQVVQRDRRVVRALLRPGAQCKVSASGKVREYRYDYLAQGQADATGDRVWHVRFHKR